MKIFRKSNMSSNIKKIIAGSVSTLILGGTFSNFIEVKGIEISLKNEIMGFATYGEGTYGGEGGEEVIVRNATELRDALEGNIPRVVYVEGTINLDELFVGSPGVTIRVGSNKTIIGLDNDAKIIRGGLAIINTSQIIIRNIEFSNAISYAPGERPDGEGGIIYDGDVAKLNPGDFTEIDSINIENSKYIWIDGNEFSDYPWIADDVPTGENRHDALVDIKRGSDFITISHNIFTNHNKNGLVGHSDTNAGQDQDALRVTYFGNWFKGTTQRNPRVRFGRVHVLNNYYEDIRSYGIGAGAGARIVAESNYFENTRRSWGHPDGVPNPMGYLLPIDNHLVNSSYDQNESGNNQLVPSDGVDWTPSEFYSYNPISATQVKDYVIQNAGIQEN